MWSCNLLWTVSKSSNALCKRRARGTQRFGARDKSFLRSLPLPVCRLLSRLMINFGMTTAGGRASAATPPRAGVQPLASPKENVVLVINTSTGICIAKIPYGTPKAGPIRAYLSARMLNDNNERLFVFRRETMNMVRSAGGIERLSDQLTRPALDQRCSSAGLRTNGAHG